MSVILLEISPRIVPNPTGAMGIVELRALGGTDIFRGLAVFMFNKKKGKAHLKLLKLWATFISI